MVKFLVEAFLMSDYDTAAEEYKVYTQKEHILNAPDMWVDSVYQVPRNEYLLINGKITSATVTVPVAVVRLFIEILANSLDNFSKSCRLGLNPGSLNVTMDRKRITVENGGRPIPIIIHPTYKMLVPEIVFGTMYSSTNYNEDRHEIGRNGLGSKLVNVFSNKFDVQVWDSINHKYWSGKWVNHMDTCVESNVSDYHGTENKVSVSYELDHNYFKMYEGYTDEVFYIVSRLCADASFTNKVPVIFNGTNYDYTNAKEYAKLYVGDKPNTMVYYEWPVDVVPIVGKDGVQRSPNGFTLPNIEMIAIDTPDSSFHISFVNSMMTPDGGCHVEAAIKSLSDSIVSYVNSGNKKGYNGKNKKKPVTGKEKKDAEKEKQKPKVTLVDVRPHLSVIVAIRIKNPVFASQTKTLYRGPEIKISIPEDLTKEMRKWNLANILSETLRGKSMRCLSKIDGVKKKHLGNAKVDDANFAGTSRSSEAILCLTEGGSAKQYVLIMRGCHPAGGDIFGVLALRGKLINAISNKPEDLAKNVEIEEINRALGLKQGMDLSSPAHRNDLRYGSILIMADQDVDGRHIKGLVMAYFAAYFPTVIKFGFLCEYVTPYLRLFEPDGSENGHEHKFYFEREYLEFIRLRPEGSKWRHKYCKGLASSSPAEVASDYITSNVIQMVQDEHSDFSMRVAFDDRKEYIDMRKKMILMHDSLLMPQPLNGSQTISQYVSDEHTIFSVANLRRHIPGMDGLKPCQRKLIHAAMKKFGRKLERNKETSVRTFCAFTIEYCNYHHGDGLADVLANMCAEYPGKLNMRYFIPESLLGCRLDGGKEAGAARYTSFKADWWIPYMFRPEDDCLLEYITDEGEQIEPETYLPILPPIYNGAGGCASGYSTFIPNFNVIDLINAMKCLINGKGCPPLIPYYEGFEGTIRIRDNRRKKTGNNLMERMIDGSFKLEDDEDRDPNVAIHFDDILDKEMETAIGKYSMITTGCNREESGKIIITELPIGVWTKVYKKWLKDLIAEKRLKDFRDLSTDQRVYFELVDFKGPQPKLDENGKCPPAPLFDIIDSNTLHLNRAYGMSNMILLDTSRHPVKFRSPEHIVEYFYNFRLPFYEKRKMKMLEKIREKIEDRIGQYNFIFAVKNKTLKLWRKKANGEDTRQARKKADIYADMDTLMINRKYLKTTSTLHFTEEKLISILKDIEELRNEYNKLEATSSKQLWLNDLEEFEVKYIAQRKKKDAGKTKEVRPSKFQIGTNSRGGLRVRAVKNIRQTACQQEYEAVEVMPAFVCVED